METVYKDQGIISLKQDKIYEIMAEWPKDPFERRGFCGKASYVVVTE